MMRLVFTTAIVFSMAFGCSLLAEGLIQASLQSQYGLSEGDTVVVGLEIYSELALGGVDFTAHYDSSKLAFVGVEQGTGLNHWELFTPSEADSFSLIQVVAIADIQNGSAHPGPQDFYPHGVAAYYTFVVTGAFAETPLEFFWLRCGDNAASNKEGDSLLVISRLLNSDGSVFWDENDDLGFPEPARPPHIGLPDSCIQRATTVYYVVEMTNGVLSTEYTCGDANGDGFVNIADGVHIIQYIFSQGPPPRPLLAGDLNCDATANITDVVYLIQYIFSSGPEPCAECP
ncbi:MAG: dockerin type I domain-containing protein [bacterium]